MNRKILEKVTASACFRRGMRSWSKGLTNNKISKLDNYNLDNLFLGVP
ncbi:MAG: hypothetical protein V7K39_15895 [Nostoc sp.]